MSSTNKIKSSSCLNKSLKSISDWANKMEERFAVLESKGTGSRFPPGSKPVSEVKAITNLEQLGQYKGEFRNWLDRLINALVQKYTRYRTFMNKLKETMDQTNKLLSDLNSHDEVNSISWLSKMERDKVE